MSVTKAELVELIYRNIGFSKKDATDIVEAFFDLIKSGIISGEKVKIKGIGTFYARAKKERLGRNPQTNKPLMISGRKVIVYRAGTSLKKLLKENRADVPSKDAGA
ncbi:MAG: integration host factor subunit alpha [Deltaproteobacteria bacterium]|nr:integration host factor subunit alpha [Deltaproteobacteria bacterium]